MSASGQTEVQVDSWLSADEERTLANDLLDGLTKPFKELSPKHLYDARGSELFELTQIATGRRYSPRPRTPSSSHPRWWASSWRTVRVTCALSSSGSWPKSRISVSRKITIRSWK